MFNKKCSKVLMAMTTGLCLLPTYAHAVGVEAGTEVINEFTLNYKSAGVDRPQVDNLANPTRFIIDHQVDLVTSVNTPSREGTPGENNFVLPYRATNTSNKDTNFTFTAVDSGTGDFVFSNITLHRYWIDEDGDGTRQDGTEPFILFTGADIVIPQDRTAYVHVRSNIPETAQDGESADINFTAIATDGSGNALTTDASNTLLGEEIILADGAGPFDNNLDAQHSVARTGIISTATLTGSKVVEMLPPEACDIATETSDPTVYNNPTPDNAGNFATPGACALYTISVTNTGSQTATDIVMVDILPDNLILHKIDTAGFLSGDLATGLEANIASGITAGNGGLACDGTNATCDGTLSNASLDAGDTGTITYRVIVES